MEHCPICDMELNGRDGKAKKHIAVCEAIEMGLLAEQLTPEVEELPKGVDYPEWPTPIEGTHPWGGTWRG